MVPIAIMFPPLILIILTCDPNLLLVKQAPISAPLIPVALTYVKSPEISIRPTFETRRPRLNPPTTPAESLPIAVVSTPPLYLRKPAPIPAFVLIAFILPPMILIIEQLALFEAPIPAP